MGTKARTRVAVAITTPAKTRRGNSYMGHGINVPARVMGPFAVFCPGYGSCFVNVALVMGLVYGDWPQLWINVSNL